MRPPTSTEMTAGHGLIAYPMLAALLVATAHAFRDTSYWAVVILLFLVLGPIANARLKRTHYLAWKREWDSMDDNTSRGRHS